MLAADQAAATAADHPVAATVADHPVVVAVLALAALATAVTTLWRTVGRPTLDLARRVADFLDDWNGQAARPGRAAVRPMPARIATLEQGLDQLRTDLGEFQAESQADRADLRARLPPTLGPGPDW